MIRQLIVLSAVLILAGCAAQTKQLQNEALLPEIDVVQVKENSDQALKISQEIKLDIDAINTKLIENDNKLTTLSGEISNVSAAKIEEIENRISLLIEAFKDMQAQIKALETMPLRSQKSQSSSGDATFSPASSVSSRPASRIVSSPEIDLYNMGLRSFNSKNYRDAIKIFTDVLTRFPSGEYADNSQFWMGECFFSMGDFTSAIKSYQKVLTINGSPKSDDAQFKIGVTYIKLGQQALARTELETLINRYPASEYVDRARKLIEEIR